MIGSLGNEFKISESKIEEQHLLYRNNGYANNPLREYNQVIEGDFYQEAPVTIGEMITRKMNKSLCFCLVISIFVAFVSYYIANELRSKTKQS